eukprot:gene14756-14927_t
MKNPGLLMDVALQPGGQITLAVPQGWQSFAYVYEGAPIKEPIVQQGPFVMNSQQEIMQAFIDYQAGTLQNPQDNVWAAEDESELR